MLNGIYLENFKSFGSMIRAEISDVTVVAGANSSGKSSVLQALLLLAQTLENPRTDVVLDLGGRYLQFAEFREAVYRRPKTSAARFQVGFDLDAADGDVRDIRTFLARSRQLQYGYDDSQEAEGKNRFEVRVTFRVNARGVPNVQSCSYRKTVPGTGTYELDVRKLKTRYSLKYAYSPIGEVVSNPAPVLNEFRDRIRRALAEGDGGSPVRTRYLRLFYEKLNEFPLISIEDLARTIMRPTSFARTDRELDQLLRDLQTLLLLVPAATETKIVPRFEHFLMAPAFPVPTTEQEAFIFSKFGDHFRIANAEIRRYLRSLQYIGPLRAKPERAYLSAGTPIGIGNSGENAVPILWVNQNDKVQNLATVQGTVETVTLGEAVKSWLGEFGLASAFHITKPERVIYQAEMESHPGSNVIVTIADVGFGVSQVLPVIVAGLWSPAGSTLVLEQPEIHLHPRLQAKLADFLICVSRLGKRVIVETHSEHLINALRLRIVEDSDLGLTDRIGILFVRGPVVTEEAEDMLGSSIEALKVDDYGKIVNWPKDFLPDAGDLSEKILRAMLSRPESRKHQ